MAQGINGLTAGRAINNPTRIKEIQMKAMLMTLVLALAACTAKIEGGDPIPVSPATTTRTQSPDVQVLKISKGGEENFNYVDLFDTMPETTRAFTFKPERDGKLTLVWMGNEYKACDVKNAKEELELQIVTDGKVANGYRIGFGEGFPLQKGLEYRVQFKFANPKTCGRYSIAFFAKYQ